MNKRLAYNTLRRVLCVAALFAVVGTATIGDGNTLSGKTALISFAPQRSLPTQKPVVELLHAIIPAAAEQQEVSHVVMMEVTAYCPCPRCCGPNAIGLTASGKGVEYNAGKFVAADPSLAFGTKLLIPGYDQQPVEVIDRGGAIKGNKLDVFFPTHEAALEWGRRTVAVTIVD